MKKKFNFGILAIVSVVFFSACGSDSDLFDPEKAVAKKEAQYASAFVRKYGSRVQEKANDVYLAGVEDVSLFSSQGYIIGNRRKNERKGKSSVTKSFEKR